jgi:uncharacterized protein YidB (DUF937 family)
MGFFDDVLKSVGGSSGAAGESHSALATAALSLLANRSGGVAGLAQQFAAHGLGDVVSSWIGTGQNMPISGEQVQTVLGPEQIESVASQAGVTPETAKSGLAQILPLLVDRLTPNGQVPQGDLMAKGMELLKGRFFS